MNWFSRLETKYNHLGVPGLMRYVAAFTALSYVLCKWKPEFRYFLWLDRDAVLAGEVWRLVTYLFVPVLGGILPDFFFCAFYILYLLWIGDGLERAMGSFRVTVYFIIGMAGTTVAAMIVGGTPGSVYFYMAMFLAFARFYPDATILLMFILPVKVKWMAWANGAFLLFTMLTDTWSARGAILAAFANYLLFFGRELYTEARFHREVRDRRARFDSAVRDGASEPLHRCHVCGITDSTHPHADFRVTDDGEEYCVEHLPRRPQP
jgi:hypothetical protein